MESCTTLSFGESVAAFASKIGTIPVKKPGGIFMCWIFFSKYLSLGIGMILFFNKYRYAFFDIVQRTKAWAKSSSDQCFPFQSSGCLTKHSICFYKRLHSYFLFTIFRYFFFQKPYNYVHSILILLHTIPLSIKLTHNVSL